MEDPLDKPVPPRPAMLNPASLILPGLVIPWLFLFTGQPWIPVIVAVLVLVFWVWNVAATCFDGAGPFGCMFPIMLLANLLGLLIPALKGSGWVS